MTESDRTELIKRMPVTKAGIVPRTIDDVWVLAERAFKAGITEAQGLNTVDKVFVAGAMGIELGIGFFQGIQNIAVIKGHATLYGDLALALVENSGFMESISEEAIIQEADGQVTGYRCTVKRTTRPEATVRVFTLRDADRANLLTQRAGKEPGSWQKYPQRMLQMRARGFALRDTFPDVLKGLYLREEMEGIEEAEVVSVEPGESRTDRMKAALGVPSPSEEEPTPNDKTGGNNVDVQGQPPGTPGAADGKLGLTEEDLEEVYEKARKLGSQEKEGE